MQYEANKQTNSYITAPFRYLYCTLYILFVPFPFPFIAITITRRHPGVE
jgi:hypothetical protein